MNRKVHAHLNELVASLHALRRESELRRAQLYWNVQRTVRNRKRAASLQSSLWRRTALRVYTEA